MNLFKNNNNNWTITKPAVNYKLVAEKFLEFYYGLYDNDFARLESVYTQNPMITFADEAFSKFSDLHRKLTSDYRICKFIHQNISFNAQPINENTILINVSGDLRVNAFDGGKFTETIVIATNNQQNYFITHTIFRAVQ